MLSQHYQLLQGAERPQLLDVVVAEEEDGEGEVGVEGGHGGQLVVGEVEVGQLAQHLQPGAVGDGVVRAVQSGEAGGPLEAGTQAGQVAVGHLQHREPSPGGD